MEETDLSKHVTFCPAGSNGVHLTGTQGEVAAVQYLVDNLNPRTVGDYQILVNYNLPLGNPGQTGNLEVDILVIDRFGVFPLEVKTWGGTIEAYDGYWLQRDSFRHPDVFGSIEHKAKVLHSRLFGMNGQLTNLGNVSVTGLVVLVRGVESFTNLSRHDGRLVIGLDHRLIQGLSSKSLLHRGQRSELLTDDDIKRIKVTLYKSHRGKGAQLIRNYRILRELAPGKLFEAFEAVNVHAKFRRVRLKRYSLPDIFRRQKKLERSFLQNVKAVTRLGNHPNILQTYDFFRDDNRPDMFYEITELPTGARLDEAVAQCRTPLPLDTQLNYLESLCEGLQYIHSHAIYHRNLSPQTVFISDADVRLGDFNFAKLEGEETISPLTLKSIFVAPELYRNSSNASPASDVYSLGVLWYYLANLPKHAREADLKQVDRLELPGSAGNLMKAMLAQVVRNRPGVEDILRELRQLRDANKRHSEVQDA